ncbi:hypothetical protein AKJ65_03555 [candidate division MSBL1 archaeon SCGC-AAA259E19]|uniref:Tritrans,polycis-undecaprenyl-diphosphate synthase (geranylgeranyl-diphosphate specific) n=1 Tax=candidate division MSBL1 archaeon SCGC-AAA259E19 TaxID=1698264 RepID=A0A133UKL4_9EURY|nr:hypothetical protein AKJ65_03555 [candidate division MSBL1 archaeon SCGC-AAA259E19]
MLRGSTASGGEKLEAEGLERPVGDSRAPLHVGIIPDGNRRYAEENGISNAEAHALGAERMEDLLEWSLDLGIEYVTAYAFSTENFKRPDEEKEALMGIYSEKFREIARDERIHENEVRVRAIGRKSLFPSKVRNAIREAEESTSDYDRFHLTVGIGYGGRAEIVDAARKLCRRIMRGDLSVDEVDEEEVGSAMYLPSLPDVDLVVRTSGERRLSGFLLWHSKSSKLYFTEKYWPEFEKEDLIGAIEAWRNSPRKGPDGVGL